MKLSINILTWNTWKTLHDTLHVLKNELKDIEHELIIVDNGSTDGCQDVATIKNKVNLGVSKGKNQGIDASKGDFIMMIDGDVVPVPNSIICLLEYMETHPDIEALGFYPDKWARNVGDYGLQAYCDKLDPVEVFKTGKGQGWCCYYGMYRRSCFDKGLRFDEKYGVGYGWEDVDFSNTMLKLGITQWVAGINSKTGKYLHKINSSISKDCLGDGISDRKAFERYMETSKERNRIYSEKWKEPILC
jgi:GT2 family glycosyltransferase